MRLQDTRLELDMKEDTLASLRSEIEEMTHGGGNEEEFAQLKKAKIEAEKLCKEQEEELDEMAGQISLLEQAKLRLEMSLETMRKEARRESQQRDDELEVCIILRVTLATTKHSIYNILCAPSHLAGSTWFVV